LEAYNLRVIFLLIRAFKATFSDQKNAQTVPNYDVHIMGA